MDVMEAMRSRHSVRAYLDRPIEEDKAETLRRAIEKINTVAGLNIQLILNEPKAFSSKLAHYGSFRGCSNYIAVVTQDGRDEMIGYYGEQLVLLAQQIGLNTCWVALTYDKKSVPVVCAPGEKLQIVIALGYGETQGTPHKGKPMERLCRVSGEMPDWFRAGMEAAMLAPTAVNQQKFRLELDGNTVRAKAQLGPFAKLDLGIVKYHFELGAGADSFKWA